MKLLSVAQLRAQIEAQGCVVIIWSPQDLVPFGFTKITEQVQALAAASKALEDRSIEIGWDVLEDQLGKRDQESNDA